MFTDVSAARAVVALPEMGEEGERGEAAEGGTDDAVGPTCERALSWGWGTARNRREIGGGGSGVPECMRRYRCYEGGSRSAVAAGAMDMPRTNGLERDIAKRVFFDVREQRIHRRQVAMDVSRDGRIGA